MDTISGFKAWWFSSSAFRGSHGNENGNFMGRVTDYLKKSRVDKKTVYYLCGNAAMIDEVSTLLEHSGIKPENMRSEVYF